MADEALLHTISQLHTRIDSIELGWVKILSTEAFIIEWRGDGQSIPIQEFFRKLEQAVEMSRWIAKDRVHIVPLKHKGPAA